MRLGNILLAAFGSLLLAVDPVFAAEGSGVLLEKSSLIALAVGMAAVGGALGQSRAIAAALDSIGRNPGAAGAIFTPFILGLVFIETLVIFTWLLTFVL